MFGQISSRLGAYTSSNIGQREVDVIVDRLPDSQHYDLAKRPTLQVVCHKLVKVSTMFISSPYLS